MHYAPMMELADMRDLGSRAVRRKGSSPFWCIFSKRGIKGVESRKTD